MTSAVSSASVSSSSESSPLDPVDPVACCLCFARPAALCCIGGGLARTETAVPADEGGMPAVDGLCLACASLSARNRAFHSWMIILYVMKVLASFQAHTWSATTSTPVERLAWLTRQG